jgi:tetratricopeptide (TPR) repeat protein
MTRRDWFRSTDWDEKTKEAFFERLSRSRSSSAKAQYLRVQAGHLQETNNKRLARAALELLDLMLAQFPEPLQVAQGQLQRAQCLASFGDFDAAVSAYRAAVEAERNFPNVRTQAWLEFGWFAVERRREQLYPEVLALLDQLLPSRRLPFPVDVFRFHGIRALIAADLGRQHEVPGEAQLAMAAAARPTSGLPHHPTVGLVDDRYSEMARRIAALAGGAV